MAIMNNYFLYTVSQNMLEISQIETEPLKVILCCLKLRGIYIATLYRTIHLFQKVFIAGLF